MSSLNPIGTPFIELPKVDSTNNYAMGLVRAGMAQHGTAVFAHEQTVGKGQRGRQWISEKNQSIAISILIEPKALDFSGLFILSMATALAVYDFINRYVHDELKIKWPNDVYWRDRKAAGILIENVWQGDQWNFAVIGIGVNINQTNFEELNSKAVSIKQITGREFQPVEMARELCSRVEDRLHQLVRNPDLISKTYKSRLYKLNEIVRLKKGNRIFEATIKHVTANGDLVVQHAVEEHFSVGEVEWIPGVVDG